MIIKDLFRNEIDRYINPVIKVQQNDINIVKKELEEYVITEQLRVHYKQCLDKYLNDSNKVGYWVSGWFGSGKSHFLKIFGYLLENHQFDNCNAEDIFIRRDETNLLKPFIEEINKRYKTTVIMFDILEEAGKLENKVEPIELTIYKQFLSKRGFYTTNLWIAEMEKDLADQGKYEEFISTVESISGKSWSDIRKSRLGQNHIQRALVRVLEEQLPTETIAKDYIEDLKKGRSISASELAKELYEYVIKLDNINGLNNRLFIIVDEIGQYVSANPDVIGYLQAIESTLARIGGGKLWVAVSSQNKLEQITEQYLKTQDEINKVIDRFEVRVHLTPENLDKVINERVLKKNSEGISTIDGIYEKNKGKLISVLDFKDSKKNLNKFTKEDFISTYPFMPYQIKLIQPIYYNVISKSSVNKKLGGTNRSMIKATQGILIDEGINVKERLVGDVVTLDMFFDQAKEFIDDQMQINIKEARELDESNGEVLVKILKVLYLLDNDDTLPKNLDTIAKLLIPNISQDYITVYKEIENCLDILFKHGYVEKDNNGNYKFISPEEQGFRQEAISRANEIGVRDRNKKIKEIVDEFFKVNRINYKGIRVFDTKIVIDDEERTSSGDVIINLNSIMQSSDELRKNTHKMKSMGDTRTIYWYANDNSPIDEDMQQYLIFLRIIDEYRKKWSGDEDKVYFLRKEEQKNNLLFEAIKSKIEKSFIEGTYIYQGQEFKIPNKTDLRSAFESLANIAIPNVYNRFNMVGVKITKDEIQKIFKENQLSIDLNALNLIQDTNVNSEAAVLKEVLNEIKSLVNKYGQCVGKEVLASFNNIPYGWASESVRLFVALLFKNGNIELSYEGKNYLDYSQSGVIDIFEAEPNFKKAIFKPAVVVDAAARQKCQDILKNIFNEPSDDTIGGLYRVIVDKLIDKRNDLAADKQIRENYDLPLKNVLVNLDGIFEAILKSKTQGDTVNNFVSKLDEYEDLYAKYNNFNVFIKNNKDEYIRIRNFVENVWAIEIDSTHRDYDDNKAILSETLNLMKSDLFIENWTVIRDNYEKLHTPYVNEYVELHNKLYDIYFNNINDLKNNKTYLTLKSEMKKQEVIKVLKSKICENEVSLTIIPCDHCKRTLREMKNLIDTSEFYKEQSINLLYEYINQQILEEQKENEKKNAGEGTAVPIPKPAVKKMNTSEFPKGILIQSPKDVKDYLKRIEKKLLEEINAGNNIIIE